MRLSMFIALFAVTISCVQKEKQQSVKKTEAVIEPENPLNKLRYENKIDFYCKMDITRYGVADTLHYNGKLYGFCSTMCKEEVKKHPEQYKIESQR